MEGTEPAQAPPKAPPTRPHPQRGRCWSGGGCLEELAPPSQRGVCRWVACGVWALMGTGRPCTARRSPLLALSLMEPPGQVVDAHVLELQQVLQAPHLHLQDLGSAIQTSRPVAGRRAATSAGPRLPSSPVPPHLHRFLRGQQLLLLFSNLEHEAWVALLGLVMRRRPGCWLPASPTVQSSLAEA